MKLQCYSDSGYAILHDAISKYPEQMQEYYTKNESWSIDYIEEHGGSGNLVYTLDSTIQDIILKLPSSTKDSSIEDIDNCIIVYDALKTLSPSSAANPKIWSFLCHETFYEYMRKRWTGDIFRRYFLTGSGTQQLIRNGIARLWWIPHMTYDSSRDDPYELTKVILRRQDDMENILGRGFTHNLKIIHSLLDVLKSKSIADYKRSTIRNMLIDLNRVGGVALLDALPDEKLHILIERKYQEHKND